MLQTTNDKALNTKIIENKRDQDISVGICNIDSTNDNNSASRRIDRNIKNLSTIAKLIKTKKPANFSKIDFLISKTKKSFIYLQKTFIKAQIFDYFDPKHYICIKTNTSRYIINRVLSQITLNQLLSNHIIYKNHFHFLKSKIGQ